MSAPRRSVLAVAVLSMLSEGPMHAYRMQQLVKERHKDDVINVSQRTSIYQTVQRLQRDGLVEVAGTERTDNRPERTTYRITADGTAWLERWLTEMLAVPAQEFPEFPAALSLLPTLTEPAALAALQERRDRLSAQAREAREQVQAWSGRLPRIFLIENEYAERVLTAELTFVEELIEALHRREVHWERESQ